VQLGACIAIGAGDVKRFTSGMGRGDVVAGWSRSPGAGGRVEASSCSRPSNRVESGRCRGSGGGCAGRIAGAHVMGIRRALSVALARGACRMHVCLYGVGDMGCILLQPRRQGRDSGRCTKIDGLWRTWIVNLG
jgi:hypothetical protein